MRFLKLIYVVSLLICLITAANAAFVIDDAAQKTIDDAVAKAITDHKTPSCAIVVGTKDSILFAKAYGRFTYDPESPEATLDTKYDLASCSKPLGTGMSLALLLEDGKLKLDDPVSKYLPLWTAEEKQGITIRNLATHTSGLPSYTSASYVEKQRTLSMSSADAMCRGISGLKLKYDTGKGWLYACLNFLTLARVNEEVAKTNQQTLLKERIWEPLGITDAGWYLKPEQKLKCAPTLVDRQGKVHDPLAYYYLDSYHCPGNAGLFLSGNDIAKICQMILRDGRWGDRQILKPETVDLFFTNLAPATQKQAWGLGWGLSTRRAPGAAESGPKTARISHTGYTGTSVQIDRYSGVFTIILTNRVYPDDNTSIGGITRAVRGVVSGPEPNRRQPEPQAD